MKITQIQIYPCRISGFPPDLPLSRCVFPTDVNAAAEVFTLDDGARRLPRKHEYFRGALALISDKLHNCYMECWPCRPRRSALARLNKACGLPKHRQLGRRSAPALQVDLYLYFYLYFTYALLEATSCSPER